MNVLVLGGTTESRILAEQLAQEGIPAKISVATRYGRERLERRNLGTSDALELRSGRLDQTELRQLIQNDDISVLVDATHPYAKVISNLAADVAHQIEKCTFVRLKRPRADIPKHSLIQDFPSPDETARKLADTNGKILLTTGTANLDRFASRVTPERLFARVLPFEESIEACRDAGLPPSHIIAMQGPFSRELNRTTYQQYDIDRLVTKCSGPGSGVRQKVTAAIQEEVEVFLIERPKLPSPDEQFVEVPSLVRWLSSRSSMDSE